MDPNNQSQLTGVSQPVPQPLPAAPEVKPVVAQNATIDAAPTVNPPVPAASASTAQVIQPTIIAPRRRLSFRRFRWRYGIAAAIVILVIGLGRSVLFAVPGYSASAMTQQTAGEYGLYVPESWRQVIVPNFTIAYADSPESGSRKSLFAGISNYNMSNIDVSEYGPDELALLLEQTSRTIAANPGDRLGVVCGEGSESEAQSQLPYGIYPGAVYFKVTCKKSAGIKKESVIHGYVAYKGVREYIFFIQTEPSVWRKNSSVFQKMLDSVKPI